MNAFDILLCFCFYCLLHTIKDNCVSSAEHSKHNMLCLKEKRIEVWQIRSLLVNIKATICYGNYSGISPEWAWNVWLSEPVIKALLVT